MEPKAGVKTSEFWVLVVSQVLTLLKTFFPDADIDPSGQATVIVTGLAGIYVLCRTLLKIFEAKYVTKPEIETKQKTAIASAAGSSLTGSKSPGAFKMILVGALALSLFSCGPKKQPVSEGAIYQALQGVSAGYGFAHEAIKKFAEIAANQIAVSCPKDPTGPLCKGAQAFKKFYEETLQPISQQATDAWEIAVQAFDVYRNLDNPTEADATDVLAKIQKVQDLIEKLKTIFAGVNFASGPVAFDAVRELDNAWNTCEQMKLEVLSR